MSSPCRLGSRGNPIRRVPRRGDTGSGVFEFVITLPLLFLALLGVADFARVWALSTAVANAANAGAQYGSQGFEYAADSVAIRRAVESDLSASPVVTASAVGSSGLRGVSGVSVSSKRICECNAGMAVDCNTALCGNSLAPNVYAQVIVETGFQPIFDYPGIPRDIRVARAAVLRAR